MHTEPEITVGHRTFSDQIWQMSGQVYIWSDILSEQILFLFFILLSIFHVFNLCLDKFSKCLIKISFVLTLCLGIFPT